MEKHIYNLRPQPSDKRDFKFLSRSIIRKILPTAIDLRRSFEPIYDQLSIGSCTANVGCAYKDMLLNDTSDAIKLSRLYLYYKEREIEGTINEDAGACMRTICKALQKFGVCEEEYMPYNISEFATKPSAEAEQNAKQYKITSYYQISTLDQIKECLAIKKRPVMIGMYVYDQFEFVDKDGVLFLPKKQDKSLGGHAVLIVGYQDCRLNKGYFIVRNSWGKDWGDHGYFYMPYEYLIRGHAFDFWTIDI